jgi:hypothetical protein
MPRLYVIPITNIVLNAPAVCDIWELVGSAGKLTRIKRVVLSASDTTIPTSQMIRVQAGVVSATAALGTGTTAGIQPLDLGDGAYGGTYTTNTSVLGTGTRKDMYNNAFHCYNGLDENFDTDGRTLAQHQFSGTGEGWYFQLLSTPTGTIHFDGTLWFEESGA